MNRIFHFFSLLILFTVGLSAQETFKFSGQIRSRFEIDNKDLTTSTSANTFTVLRTRLGFEFKPINSLSGFIQLQDSRIFGEEVSTTASSKNIDLHQAYFIISNFFDLPIELQIGRFEVVHGSERFIGAVGWQNAGRSFDGGLIKFKTENVNISLLAAREFEKFLIGDSTDQNVYALLAVVNVLKSYKIQPFAIWQRMQPTNFLDRVTLGFYLKGEFEKFYHEIDFGYQLGSLFFGGRKQDISAYTFSINAGYHLEGYLKPVVIAQVDVVSGDDISTDNKYKSFSSLYGTGHKFFGYMDYFVSFPNDNYRLGLSDFSAKLKIEPISNLKLNLDFHLFNSLMDYTLSNGAISKLFGSEVDLIASYKYNANIVFEGGASLFSAGDIFKEKRGKDDATWFYLMALVNL